VAEAARRADAVTFTSSSTVTGYLAAIGPHVPPVVACIGPITARTARDAGIDVTVVAEEHSVDGLVRALAHALAHATAEPSPP
jgi:uroporphyrinogen-III synthase